MAKAKRGAAAPPAPGVATPAPIAAPDPVAPPPAMPPVAVWPLLVAAGAGLLAAGALLGPAAAHPAVHVGALVAVAVAAVVGLLAASGTAGQWPAAGAAVAALVAGNWAECAWPEHARWGEPVRASLAGIGPTAWIAIAVAGLVAGVWSRHPGPRWVAAAGAAGLAVHTFMPVGIAGETQLPVLAVLQPPLVATAAGRDAVATAVVGGPWMVLAAALAALVLMGLVLRRNWPIAWSVGAAAALTLTGVVGTAESGQAAALLCAGAVAVTVGAWVPQLMGRDHQPPATFRSLGAGAEPWIIALLVAAFGLLKINGLRYSTTDEALYFYAARLWTEGTLPYRDFFFSHPPLHIAIPALLYKLLGYHFLIGKLLSAAAALVAALFSWRLARHWMGPWAGMLALAFNLLACEVLQASTNLTGVNLTTAAMMAGLWALWCRRNFLVAGLLLGTAACTGFYAFGAFLVATVLTLLLPWPDVRRSIAQWARHPTGRLVLGFLLVWGGINVVFWAIGGQAYTIGVYSYHFAKKAKVEGFTAIGDSPFAVPSNFFLMLGARDFMVSVYYHAAHWWMALWMPLAVAWRMWAERSRALRQMADPRQWWAVPRLGLGLAFTMALALTVEFAQFKERYDFYFALILPLLSLCAAAFVSEVVQLAAQAVDGLPSSVQRRAIAGTLALTALGFCWMPVDMAANKSAYPTEFKGAKMEGKGPGERLEFEWLPAPGPAWTTTWTKALLWQPQRIRASVESGMHHYLWGKKRWFSKADEMAAYIAANSAPDETISGASDYAPLLALLSGRRMAGNHVDTNSKVFNTGAVPLEKFWDEACKDKLKFLVVAPQSYFAAPDLAKRSSIMENFQRDKVFADPALKHWRPLEMELWVRKGPQPCTYKGQRGTGPRLDAAPRLDD